MIPIALFHNLALLITLCLLNGFLMRWFQQRGARTRLLAGLLFGAATVVGMATPVVQQPGLIFDGRSIVLGIAGLFGGPLVAGVAALVALAYRLHLGGTGALMGALVILESAVLGVAGHLLKRRWKGMTRPLPLMALGFCIHLAMVALMRVLPGGMGAEVVRRLGPFILVGYPVAFMVVALVFLELEQHFVTERALKESERTFAAAFRKGPVPMTISEIDTGRMVDVNEAWVQFSGYSREELIGRTSIEVGLLRAEDRLRMHGLLREAGHLNDHRLVFLTKDGRRKTCMFSCEIITVGGEPRLLSTGQDITVLTEQAEELERLTHLYSALSQVSQAIVFSPTREALLAKVCEVMVAFGGFSMAWIAWNDPATRDVKILAQYGDHHGYLEDLRVRSDDGPLGQGGTSSAIRTGLPCVQNDFLGSPDAAPWYEAAQKARFEASAAFPIRMGGAVCGSLSVYAGARHFFGPMEVRLLEEAAGDLSYALDHLALEAQRVQSALEIQRLTDLLRESQAIGRVGGWEIDLNAQTLHWTEETFRIHDLTPEEYAPTLETAIAFYAPESLATIQAAVKDAIATGRAFDLELQLVTAKGRRVWVHTTCRPMREDGRTVRILGAFRDITESKREKQALLEKEAELRAVFDHSRDAIAVGRGGLHILSNPAYRAMFGYGPEEGLAGLPIEAFYAEEDRPRLRDIIAARREGRAAPAMYEIRARRKDGTVFDVETQASQYVLQGETYTLAILRDITERNQAERERRSLEAQLHQAQKMDSLGGLAGGIAHDMNNVLGAILGLASAHEELQSEGSPVREVFATIVKAAERGGKMVKGLLSFARRTTAEERQLDLNTILLEQVSLLERTTFARIRIELDLAPDLRPILGDAGGLAHAFMNLSINAVDAMPEGGTLTLRTRNLESGSVEIQVEDTGTGMPREVLDRAMDPFFTTKDQGKGTGLGLAMVYTTVKAHKGSLELHSEPGRGTRATLSFPATSARDAGPGASARLRPEAPGAPLQVLLVDDDELVQTSTRTLLQVLGHGATSAASGEEALALLGQGFRPDAVILDMNMPGLGGRGALPRLRALCPEVPVLLATGRADQTALDLIAAHPHVILLPKPYSLQELKDLLEPIAAGREVQGP